MLRRALTAMAVASLIVAACGGDDDGDATEAATAAGTDQDTVEETAATPTSTGGATSTTGEGDASGGEVCTEERVGGDVTLANGAEPRGLDPIKTPGTGNTGGNELLAIYDTLVRYDAENDSFEPVVAESLEPNDDFSEWTLKLREGVTFGNGDPLTAAAVQASFARHQVPENRSANFQESLAVTEMEVVDDLTLVFRLDGPWVRFPSLLAHNAGMVVNPAVVEAMGEGFTTNPVGGGVGPYEVERWVPGEELLLRAKTDWWGGPVCIEQIRFITIDDPQAMYDAFLNGDIDIAYSRDPRMRGWAAEDGYDTLNSVQNSGTIFVLNHANGPTTDLGVRQAIAAAIDPEVINERAYGGTGLATTALIAEESVHYSGLEGPQPDAARAAELVEQAKANGWDGKIELTCQNSPELQEACIASKAMMDAAGMEVTINSMQVNDMITRVLVDRNFQMASWAQTNSDAAPSLRLSASNSTNGSLNVGGYSNPEMDAALVELRQAPDQAALQAALAEVQRIWNETLPSVVYAAVPETFVLPDYVKGLVLSQNSQVHFDTAYLDR